MNAYLLSRDNGLYLAFGNDAVSAATSLLGQFGGKPESTDAGSWPVREATVIHVSDWWPHFTSAPVEGMAGSSTTTIRIVLPKHVAEGHPAGGEC